MNKENFKEAIKFFATLDNPDQFDMSFFFITDLRSINQPQKIECGAIACAAGWSPNISPAFKILPEDKNWVDYSYRVYGLDDDLERWSWLFSADWTRMDNTPLGVSKRMQYLLNNNKPPADFEQQMLGKVPYIFQTVS